MYDKEHLLECIKSSISDDGVDPTYLWSKAIDVSYSQDESLRSFANEIVYRISEYRCNFCNYSQMLRRLKTVMEKYTPYDTVKMSATINVEFTAPIGEFSKEEVQDAVDYATDCVRPIFKDHIRAKIRGKIHSEVKIDD